MNSAQQLSEIKKSLAGARAEYDRAASVHGSHAREERELAARDDTFYGEIVQKGADRDVVAKSVEGHRNISDRLASVSRARAGAESALNRAAQGWATAAAEGRAFLAAHPEAAPYFDPATLTGPPIAPTPPEPVARSAPVQPRDGWPPPSPEYQAAMKRIREEIIAERVAKGQPALMRAEVEKAAGQRVYKGHDGEVVYRLG
jgi:hypothetical protein